MLVFVSACEEVVQVESITVTGELSVEVGEQAAYTAVIMPIEAQNAPVTWSIVNGTGEATITTNGVMSALSPGTVTVKAVARGVEGELSVSITLAATGVSISGPDAVMLGSTGTYDFTLEPENATFKSAVWAVLAGTGSATITQEGLLTPVNAGTVTVRINVDGMIETKQVTIKTPVTSFTINGPAEVRMEETPTYTISLLPPDADVDEVVWSVSEGTGDATITQAGVLTPVSAGTVTVSVDVDGLLEEIEVEIIVSVASIEVVGEEVILPSARPEYEALVLPENAKYNDVVWSVVNQTGSATITQAGVLTPVTSGLITIVATADGIEGTLEVEIEQDDRLLGTPRPSHLLATPENTLFVDGQWELAEVVEGLEVEFARQVYDVMFTQEASRSNAGVFFSVPNDVDISRMQYFAIKVTGMTQTPGVNPTVSVQLRDFASGLFLFNDQQTEIEITQANQWLVFSVSNRYRLQTEDRDLRILVDPHFTASGNAGQLTIQQVVFFGDQDPVTEPQLLTPLKNAHWEATPVFTAEAATDEIDGVTVDVIHAKASVEAVSGWRALPAYVLEDIARKTHVTFKVKLLTEGLTANPRLLVTLGDTDVQNVTITRPAPETEAVYQTVTVAIPQAMRTENNMWAARYIQVKANTGGTPQAVEYYIYDFKLMGDANPTPITATRTVLGGPNVPLSGSINYVENATAIQVPANDEPAHVLFTPNAGSTLSKLEFGYEKTTGNSAAREGMNGVYVKIQGSAGVEINIQQGWGDGWADESQRKFALDGTVQEVYIIALNRSSITTGTGWFPFQFGATIPGDLEDVEIKIYEFAFTAIFPEQEPVYSEQIHFGQFIEGGNTVVTVDEEDIDTMTVEYNEQGHAIAQVNLDNQANHIVGIAVNNHIRNMNTLTLHIQGEVGTQVTIKLAYGNMFNMDVDYVHTFTSNEVEEIVINIQDRDALKVNKISVSLFFSLNEVETTTQFIVQGAFFSGIEE
jgi:hypothetical protein